jgi:hypothetical protein
MPTARIRTSAEVCHGWRRKRRRAWRSASREWATTLLNHFRHVEAETAMRKTFDRMNDNADYRSSAPPSDHGPRESIPPRVPSFPGSTADSLARPPIPYRFMVYSRRILVQPHLDQKLVRELAAGRYVVRSEAELSAPVRVRPARVAGLQIRFGPRLPRSTSATPARRHRSCHATPASGPLASCSRMPNGSTRVSRPVSAALRPGVESIANPYSSTCFRSRTSASARPSSRLRAPPRRGASATRSTSRA